MQHAKTKPVDGDSSHRLDPLLSPRSIALVGASPRQGSVGNKTVITLLNSGFAGPIDFVNPRYTEIEGKCCVDELSELETPPDLAILNVGAARLEATVEQTILSGAKSAVIFDACQSSTRNGESLLDRLRSMAREADFPICGGNGMGFFNVPDRCHASFYSATQLKTGGISLIAHSGSVFTLLALNDPRYRFDLAISSGQEIAASVDEYVDYVITRPTTRVIALFMEGSRDPQGFMRALEKAHKCSVPVVVCKVGRTAESASLAVSHTGAMAGSYDAYRALFEKYGVIAVDTIDQLMNVSMLLSHGREMGEGEVATITDSGGLRELFIDRAQSHSVPLANFSMETEKRLRNILPETLPPSNPLDCAGAINENFSELFKHGLEVLAGASEVGLLGYEIDASDDHTYDAGLVDIALQLPQITDKPCFVYSSFSGTHNRSLSDCLADVGVPLLNGLDEVLSAISLIRNRREVKKQLTLTETIPSLPDVRIVDKWHDILVSKQKFGEARGLAMLSDFGIAAVENKQCNNLADTLSAAGELGYPVVLKTASADISHKTVVGGVVVGLNSERELEKSYIEMSNQLGRDVLVQKVARGGVELAFGFIKDPDFGPLVMVSAGGTLIELFEDRQFALAPFGRHSAMRTLKQLKLFPLLKGTRGTPACDIHALVAAFSAFSTMCATLCEPLTELDVNPVIVNEHGVTAVDALVRASSDLAQNVGCHQTSTAKMSS